MKFDKKIYSEIIQLLTFSFPIYISGLGISTLDILIIILAPSSLINLLIHKQKINGKILYLFIFIFFYFLLIGSFTIAHFNKIDLILVSLRRLLVPISILVSYDFINRLNFKKPLFQLKIIYAIAPLISILLSFYTGCSSTYSPVCFFESSSYSSSYLALGSFIIAISILSINKKGVQFKEIFLKYIAFFLYPLLILSFFSRGSFLSLLLVFLFFIFSKYKLVFKPDYLIKINKIRSLIIFFFISISSLYLILTKVNLNDLSQVYRIKDFLLSFSSPMQLFEYVGSTGRFITQNNENYFTQRFLDQCGNGIENIILGCGNGIRYLQRGSWSSPSDYDSFWRLIFVDYGIIFTIIIFIIIIYLQVLAIKKLLNKSTEIYQSWLLSYFLSITVSGLFTNELFMLDGIGPQSIFIVFLAFSKKKLLPT